MLSSHFIWKKRKVGVERSTHHLEHSSQGWGLFISCIKKKLSKRTFLVRQDFSRQDAGREGVGQMAERAKVPAPGLQLDLKDAHDRREPTPASYPLISHIYAPEHTCACAHTQCNSFVLFCFKHNRRRKGGKEGGRGEEAQLLFLFLCPSISKP